MVCSIRAAVRTGEQLGRFLNAELADETDQRAGRRTRRVTTVGADHRGPTTAMPSLLLMMMTMTS